MSKKVIVVGAGAAGMMAAIAAAEAGNSVTVLEKNEKAGKKIYITGKGRCNLTNACDVEDLFKNVVTNKKFLYSAFYGYTNDDVINFFNENGTETKVERGNRVFPVSDRSSDVISALVSAMRKNSVRVMYNIEVKDILTENTKEGIKTIGVMTEDGPMKADAVIVATGGVSYPSTGSTGDGYRFAKSIGHSIVDTTPALVPLNAADEDIKELQGLALKNAGVTIYDGKKKVFDDFGELLFTHFGVSGPTIIKASSLLTQKIKERNLTLYIDLKPALSYEELDQRVLRDFDEMMNKNFNNSLDKLLPKSLIPVVISRAGIDPYKKVNEISHEERTRLVSVIKKMEFTLTGLRGYNEAIITQGGINVKEIDPYTMESKLCKNLYFAGEVLDLDAFTGGFNLQIAWSTGHLAGISV